MIDNVSFSYFCKSDEEDALVVMYNKAYKIALKNNDITLIFIDLSGGLDTITIDDLTNPIPYNTYSEYRDYTFEELEEQIYYVYKEFFNKGIFYEPIVIMIHDVTKMCEDNDDYQIIKYLDDKKMLLELMDIYIFCTIRDK